MLFVTLTSRQAVKYKYMCTRLSSMMSKMSSARQVFENIAHTSFNKLYSSCMYLLASESLQCENEIRSHINSLNCYMYENIITEKKENTSPITTDNSESICRYLEDIYLTSYKKLLNDKNLGAPVKDLIQNHMRLFMSSLTQMRLFNELQPLAN